MEVELYVVKKILKETYLEIANNYSVSDLHYDSDKVSCVASAFRQKVLEKLIRETKKRNDNPIYIKEIL